MRLASLCLASVLLVAGACSSGDDGAPATSAETTTSTDGGAPAVPDDLEDLTGRTEVEITITDNAFGPDDFIVDAGTTITFVNTGRNDHDVTPAQEGAFEGIPLSALGPGGSAQLVIDVAGDYPMYCSIHGTATFGQTGYIRVVG